MSNYCGTSLLSISNNIFSSILLLRLSPYADEIVGVISVGFNITHQLLIRYSCICQILEQKWEYNVTVHQLFIDFKIACDSVRRKEQHYIFTESGGPLKLFRLRCD
jgi:hypothetical protein